MGRQIRSSVTEEKAAGLEDVIVEADLNIRSVLFTHVVSIIVRMGQTTASTPEPPLPPLY